jgi:hypothetical protein
MKAEGVKEIGPGLEQRDYPRKMSKKNNSTLKRWRRLVFTERIDTLSVWQRVTNLIPIKAWF